MAVFFQVSARDPDAARLLETWISPLIAATCIASKGRRDFRFPISPRRGNRHVGQRRKPYGRRARLHLVFVREKGSARMICPPFQGFPSPRQTVEEVLLAPVPDLVRMKLTSFRLKDKTHIVDMDSVGLITPEIEAGLPDALRDRLQQVRAEERGA